MTDPTEGGLAKIESKTWPKENQELFMQDSERRKWADKSRGHPREAVPIEGFRHLLSMRNEQLRQEGENPIRKEEFFGARLYTGPMYLKCELLPVPRPGYTASPLHCTVALALLQLTARSTLAEFALRVGMVAAGAISTPSGCHRQCNSPLPRDETDGKPGKLAGRGGVSRPVR